MASILDQFSPLERFCLQALWEIRATAGFDNDGDEAPGAMIAAIGPSAFVFMVKTDVTQAVRELTQALNEWERRFG